MTKAEKNFKQLDELRNKELSKDQIKQAHKQAQKNKVKERVL